MLTTPAPLGFCLRCISNSLRTPATTLFEGTSACDACALVALGLEAQSRRSRLDALAVVDAQSAPPGP